MLMMQRLPWAIFLMVPSFAIILRILYRRQKRFFVPHLIFALHFHTMAYLLMVSGELVDVVIGIDQVSKVGALTALVLLFFALRRVYGGGRFKTFIKQSILLSIHGFVLSFINAITTANPVRIRRLKDSTKDLVNGRV